MHLVEYVDSVARDAFHGTSKSKAERIKKTREFIPSKGPDCYLGDGVYFFEEAKSLAERWARKQCSGQGIGIIVAEIQLGKCLNLLNADHRNLIKLTYEKIRLEILRQAISRTPRSFNGIRFPETPEGINDAIVINFYASKIDPTIETVRSYFTWGKEKIFKGSRIYEWHGVICVRKRENILNFRMVYGGP